MSFRKIVSWIYFVKLHIKSNGRNHALLALFLERAVAALRKEVRELERALKNQVRRFEVLSQLAEYEELR